MRITHKALTALCLALICCLALPLLLPAETGLLPAAEAASKIHLSQTEAEIDSGSTLQLTLEGTKKTVTWSSSNKTIATVSKKGLVTAQKAGKVKIRAKAGGKTYTCALTVKAVMKVSKKSVTLDEGKSTAVSVTFRLKGVKLKCAVDNADVAKISLGAQKDGKTPLTIIAGAPGTAKVTLSNEKTKDKLTIKVTVKGAGKLTGGDIQRLYGKTVKEANALLNDRLVSAEGDWANNYFAVKTDASGKIRLIDLYKGTKYSLYGVTIGMEWKTAIAKLTAAKEGWELYYEDSKGVWYKCPAYSDRAVYLEKHSKVEEIWYWELDS